MNMKKRLRYTAVIEWDSEDRVYVATVPALRVSTYAETREKVLEKVKEAITVTIEGLQAVGQLVPQGDEDKVETVEVTVCGAFPGPVAAKLRIGFVEIRVRGSHHFLVHREDSSRWATVPIHGGRILPLSTLRTILTTARVTAEELRELL